MIETPTVMIIPARRMGTYSEEGMMEVEEE